MSASFDMARLRTRLLLDQPFFGTLAMHLDLIEDATVETLQTNGVWVKYNPAYLATLTTAEQVGVLAHEVLHPALLHPYRRAGRDLREWNEACDFAINAQLVAAGFTLPAGVLLDPQFDGLSAEQIYSKRRSQAQPPQPEAEPEPEEDDEEGDSAPEAQDPGEPQDQHEEDGDENSEGDTDADFAGDAQESSMPGSPTGEFIDGPETASTPDELTASDWEVIAEEAAAVAARAGELPGGLGRALKATREPVVDWKAETRAFLTSTIETDYAWSTPNRRFISRGLYLPGPLKENVGPLVVAVDTSASITQAMLDQFANELSGLMREARPERLHVVYCDARVQGVEEFTADDEEIKLTLAGGGGTAFQPVFDYVEEQQIDPLGLIYLTDLEGPAPTLPPYPVLWVTPLYATYPAPFGQIVRIP